MNLPMLADRRSYDDAAALIETHGDHAGIEAAHGLQEPGKG